MFLAQHTHHQSQIPLQAQQQQPQQHNVSSLEHQKIINMQQTAIGGTGTVALLDNQSNNSNNSNNDSNNAMAKLAALRAQQQQTATATTANQFPGLPISSASAMPVSESPLFPKIDGWYV